MLFFLAIRCIHSSVRKAMYCPRCIHLQAVHLFEALQGALFHTTSHKRQVLRVASFYSRDERLPPCGESLAVMCWCISSLSRRAGRAST